MLDPIAARPVLWLDPAAPVPHGWQNWVVRADIRAHTYHHEGCQPLVATEQVWQRRREIGRELSAAFMARIEGRTEADALAPFAGALQAAVAQRCAAGAFMDCVVRDLRLDIEDIAVVQGSDLAKFAADWLGDRLGTFVLDDGRLSPFEPASVRHVPPVGDSPATSLLQLIGTVEVPPSLQPQGSVVAITSLSHGTQSVTLAPVVRALRESEPVLLINTAPRALPDMPEHALLQDITPDAALAKAAVDDIMGLWANSGPFVEPSMQRLFARTVQQDVPKLAVLDNVLQTVGQRPRPHLVGTTDSTYTSDFMRARAPVHGVRRTTIQNAFVSGSARYTKPETDRLLTIDSWSSGVIAESFGVDPDIMEVVGSARYAHLPVLRDGAETGLHGKAEWLETHGFQAGARLFAFAAQPSAHSSGALAFLHAMEAEFAGDKEVAFALRLHPKEFDPVRRSVLAGVEASKLQVVVDTRTIEQFLVTADAVLTEFSNVGLEAGIVGKPLVILKLPGSPAFPPLDEFAIGRTVASYGEAAQALRELMASGPRAAGFPDTSEEFARLNPGLYNGDTVEAILRSIASDRG